MWRGTTFPMWSNKATGGKGKNTDGGTRRETHPQRGAAEGVTTLDSLSHASTATDVLSPGSCMKRTQNPHYAHSEGIVLYGVCVWVCAHESTCLINHWNPPHQSLTNRQHSKPGTRGQDRSQVVELTVQISCWTAKTKQNFYRGLC